jgi:predicted carbohydrate-binding protein with CBM5 and CBM33 domain
MRREIRVNRYALAVLAVFATVFLAVAPGTPAAAHGALSTPMSRATACAADGPHVQSDVCKAAIAADGGAAVDWANIRVPNVDGKDREKIPDGKLCSGGLPQFQGLDLPRGDWPTTTLPSGGNFTFSYKSTIAHKGSFRLYLTRDGWSPTQAPRWGDLGATPFLTVKDPPLKNGAYQFGGRIPAGRSGRQLVLAIWQTSNSPDTYYSCADVVLNGSEGVPASRGQSQVAAGAVPGAIPPSPGSEQGGDKALGQRLTPLGSSRVAVSFAAGAVVVVALAGGGWFLWRRRRA